MARVVLAHSGRVETSRAIAWLLDAHGAEVVTVTLDVGQGAALNDVQERALVAGAARAHVLDVREELANAFLLPVLRAGALAPPPIRALGTAILAKHLVEIAAIEGAPAVAYGGTADGANGMMEALLESLDPSLEAIVVEPGRRAASMTANLVGRCLDVIPASDSPRPDDFFLLSKAPAEAPDQPAYIDLAFERGNPIAVNDVEMPPVELIQSLETIAGAHGIGRTDAIEVRGDRRVHVLYDAPAAAVLHAAHVELRRLVLSPLRPDLAARYGDLLSAGLWHTPARAALDALVNEAQVTGVVRLRLHQGECRLARHARERAGGPAGLSDARQAGRP